MRWYNLPYGADCNDCESQHSEAFCPYICDGNEIYCVKCGATLLTFDAHIELRDEANPPHTRVEYITRRNNSLEEVVG